MSRNPTAVASANREVQTNEEATVYVCDLDLFVRRSRISPVLPVRLQVHLQHLAKSSDHTTQKCTQWSLGDQPHDFEQTEDKNLDIDLVLGTRLHDLPEWMKDFTENLVDEGVSAPRDTPASTSRESDHKLSRKVASGKQRIFTHFPNDRNCKVFKKDQNDKDNMQEAH